MVGRLEPGATLGVHTHTEDSETVYYLSGTGRMYYDGQYEPVAPGKCITAPRAIPTGWKIPARRIWSSSP